MPATVSPLSEELMALHKGRGVHGVTIVDRIGPSSREISGIAERDTASTLRRKLTTTLRSLTSQLPEDLQTAAEVALALHQEFEHAFLWIA